MSFLSSSRTSSPTSFERAFPNYQAFLSNNRCLHNTLIQNLPPPTDLQLTYIIHDGLTTQVIPRLSPPLPPSHSDVSDPVGAFITEITNSDNELDAAHELQLQAANILCSSVNLHVTETPWRIGPVWCQHMHSLTSTEDEVPTNTSQQRYWLWVYHTALVSSTSTLHHIQIHTAMHVLDFIPFPLPDLQFITPFQWAV